MFSCDGGITTNDLSTEQNSEAFLGGFPKKERKKVTFIFNPEQLKYTYVARTY
jgi:hypothetical protein